MIGLLTQSMRRLRLLTWKRCRRGFVLGMLCVGFSMSGCESLRSINAKTDVSCALFKPITWSDKDTKSTLKEIFLHNTTFDSVCVKDANK